MEKLTIEQLAPSHLIPYLNHKLQFEVEWSDKIKHKEVLTYIDISNNQIRLGVDNYYTLGLEDNIKPILHDLSSLTKPINHEGKTVVVASELFPLINRHSELMDIVPDKIEDIMIPIMSNYNMIQILLKYHFNVFNIPSHLFIDKLNLK